MAYDAMNVDKDVYDYLERSSYTWTNLATISLHLIEMDLKLLKHTKVNPLTPP